MRVLHVIPSIAARYGGPSAAIVGMCRALRSRGVDASMATTDADGPTRLDVPLGTWVESAGVPTIFFRRYAGEAIKLSPGLARWLDRHARDYDVVHAHAVFSHAPLAAARACRRAGVPLIVRPLGTLDPWSMAQKPIRKRAAWHLGVERMLRGAAAIHYTTEGERRRAESSLGLARGVSVPLGVDPDLEAQSRSGQVPPALAGEAYVLALGRLHPKKGLEGLISAFAAAQLGAVRLAIAGDGEPAYVSTLERLARARAGERVIFTGWVSGERKAAILAHAAVLAMPSFQENFGISAAEAMTLGVPVLLARAVNLAEEVEAASAGWIADEDQDGLRRALRAAMSDATERRARGERARDLARRCFTWERAAADLEALYRALVAQARS